MDIPSEVVWIVMMLAMLGVVLAVVIFFSFQAGSFRILDLILGFFR